MKCLIFIIRNWYRYCFYVNLMFCCIYMDIIKFFSLCNYIFSVSGEIIVVMWFWSWVMLVFGLIFLLIVCFLIMIFILDKIDKISKF